MRRGAGFVEFVVEDFFTADFFAAVFASCFFVEGFTPAVDFFAGLREAVFFGRAGAMGLTPSGLSDVSDASGGAATVPLRSIENEISDAANLR